MTSLGIQLGNLRTVSPRGCHWKSLWPHPVLTVGLPHELCFSQSTTVIQLPCHMALSQQEGGQHCIMRDVGKAGMSAHREGHGHKAYQLQLPQGSISELKWRALGQTFSLFGKISTFSTGKENKNTMQKSQHFSAQIYPAKVWETTLYSPTRTGLLLRSTKTEGGNQILPRTNQIISLGA